jgi:hypothetical protein
MTYTLANPAQETIFWAFNDDVLPCLCCSALNAIEHDTWACTGSGRTWIITAPGPTPATWGDIAEKDFAEAECRMTEAQRLLKAAALAAEMAERAATAASARMFNYAQEQKLANMRGKGTQRAIGKVNEPCRWLYCDEKAPDHMWTTNAKGERCAPVRQALTGAACWAHEYIHPKSGLLLKPHTCKRLHPNEDGWMVQWNTDRTFKPSAPTAADGFFAVRMASAPKVVMVAPKKAAVAPKPQRDNSAW